MSVPRKAVTEEPSTEPLSPRGTLLNLTHATFLYSSLPAMGTRAAAYPEHLSLGKPWELWKALPG